MSFKLYSNATQFIPAQEELKRYKWYAQEIMLGPLALVTFRNTDIVLELIQGIPTLLDPKLHPDIYYGLINVRKSIAKYVRVWSSSGFYKSMHLKEFLDQVTSEKES